MTYTFLQNGDTAVTVQFENEISEKVNGCVTALARNVENKHIHGVVELIPTFTSLTVIYNPLLVSSEKLKCQIKKLIPTQLSNDERKKTIYRIPVCYDGEFAPDIQNVTEHNGISREKVVELHTSRNYLIYMLGFLPGFAYLGGLDERLYTPRLKSPRQEIFAGAVGIGGEQTGIYPVPSPGGWQLIGRTPVRVYDKEKESPVLYKAGDYIRFYSISADEYYEIEKAVENGLYIPERTVE